MINQDVCNFYNAQGVYAEYGGLVLGVEEGRKMAEALGPKGKGLTVMNHGLLTVGQTGDEAAYLFRLMEKSCEAQLLVEAAAANGIQKQIIRDEEAAYNFEMASEAVSLCDLGLRGFELKMYRKTYIASFSQSTSTNSFSLEAHSKPDLDRLCHILAETARKRHESWTRERSSNAMDGYEGESPGRYVSIFTLRFDTMQVVNLEQRQDEYHDHHSDP